jgi:hypothetical protein
MNYEKADLGVGIVFVIIGAAAMIALSAAVFAGTPQFGNFTDAGGVAAGIEKYAGQVPGVLFALALMDASIIGAAAVSLSTAYAIGDVLSLRHSLHRKPTDAIGFYLVYVGLIAGAAALVLIPDAPLGLITVAVQTLAGVLLPSATVFLLLLCNDGAVLGPWVNGKWLNRFTGAVIAVLVLLSVILTASVLFPDITGTQIMWIMGGGAVLAVIGAGMSVLLNRREPVEDGPALPRAMRAAWRMPPLDELAPARISASSRTWMMVLRVYLVLACAMVIVRVVQLALGHG